jgi:hypothetical protein
MSGERYCRTVPSSAGVSAGILRARIVPQAQSLAGAILRRDDEIAPIGHFLSGLQRGRKMPAGTPALLKPSPTLIAHQDLKKLS